MLFLKLHKLGIIRAWVLLYSQRSHLSLACEHAQEEDWLLNDRMERTTESFRAYMPPLGSNVSQIGLGKRLRISCPAVWMLLPLNSAQFHTVCPFHFTGWLITLSSTMCRPWPCSAACLKPNPGYRGAQTLAPFLLEPPTWPPTADMYDCQFFPICLDYLLTSLI